jgi:hypothetical protein
MPSDLSIGAAAPSSAFRQAESAGTEAAATTTAPVAATPTSPALPNPTLRLDPALGLVVIEFLSKGAVTTSIPTQRELAAYQDGTAELPGTTHPTTTVQSHA